MNSELMKQALIKVGNANVLVNVISRRVRQLTTNGARPLLADTTGMGAADIAMKEIVEEKMAWEMEIPKEEEPHPAVVTASVPETPSQQA